MFEYSTSAVKSIILFQGIIFCVPIFILLCTSILWYIFYLKMTNYFFFFILANDVGFKFKQCMNNETTLLWVIDQFQYNIRPL